MVGVTAVVVVGASAAGFGTAEALRRESYRGRIHVIDPDVRMPYDRPPLSKQFLLGEWEEAKLSLRPPAVVAGLNLDLHLGRSATSLDVGERRLVLDDGTDLTFDELVVATGVRPLLPEAWRSPGVFALRSLDDAEELRARLAQSRRVVVVGAGFIGSEVAATCAASGLQVTLVDPEPAPMARVLGEQLGQMVRAVHEAQGVDVRCGVRVSELVPRVDGSSEVLLTDGARLDADAVVVGMGSRPNVDWLAGTGLVLEDGLGCDEHGRAADAIWGVGDVAAWMDLATGSRIRVEHRLHAAYQAQHVARSIACSSLAPFEATPYFWSDQHHLRIQAFGRLLPGSEVQIIAGSTAERRLVAHYVKNGVVVGVLGVNMPKETRVASSMLGSPADTGVTADLPRPSR